MSKRLSPKIINWLEVNVPGRPWKEVIELPKNQEVAELLGVHWDD